MPQHEWLKTEEAAEHMGFKRKTLDNWRSEGRGPRYSRVGRSIRYHILDLEKFMTESQVRTSDAA